MTHSRSFLAALASTITALLLTLGLMLSATPAMAHAGLTSSTPEDGATLKALPGEIVLEFTEEVSTPAFVAVTDPDNRRLESGDPVIDGATVRQSIDPATHAGLHTIAYRVVSADGHPVTGHVRVTVEFPAEEESDGEAATLESPEAEASESESPALDAADAENDDSGTNRAPLIAGGVVLLLVALLLGVLALTKRGRR